MMNRTWHANTWRLWRTCTVCLASTLGIAWLLFCGPSRVTAADGAVDRAPRPNMVVVMLDDLGFSDLGCYGSEIETPNIDRLAAEGLRFSQFYNTAKCEISRVCLLSGLYTYQAGYRRLSATSSL